MKVKPLPSQPFTNEPFRDDGGGIDYLGLQVINLRMLAEHLLPGVNNATRDIGIFCLGVWIPWKFRQICDQKHFTEDNYRAFRQAFEVIMADAVADGSEANEKFGMPHRRIGVSQNLSLPAELAFSEAIQRKEVTSLYAAPLYGPSLRYLGFLGYSSSEDRAVTQILIPYDDEDTQVICQYVDSLIGDDPLVQKLSSFDFHATEHEVRELQAKGLHPAAYLEAPPHVLRALARHILDQYKDADNNYRLRSARLIVQTIEAVGPCSADELRAIWYTGVDINGNRLSIEPPELETQRQRWACFEHRQLQRHILERFLIHFEQAIAQGNTSIPEVAAFTLEEAPSMQALTFRELITQVSTEAEGPEELEAASTWWNQNIGVHHPHSEAILKANASSSDTAATLSLLAKWILRSGSWLNDEAKQADLTAGGEARIGMKWFYSWVLHNSDKPILEFLHDIYSTFIFSQHLRVGLSRLNPGDKMQRLRFVLGDFGITSTLKDPNVHRDAPWMADRLEAWLDLLSDLRIVDEGDDGQFTLGENVGFVNES